MKTIPVAYLSIINRLYKSRNLKNEIATREARRILGMIYHYNKEEQSDILQELFEMGWIKLRNTSFVEIIWKPENLI